MRSDDVWLPLELIMTKLLELLAVLLWLAVALSAAAYKISARVVILRIRWGFFEQLINKVFYFPRSFIKHYKIILFKYLNKKNKTKIKNNNFIIQYFNERLFNNPKRIVSLSILFSWQLWNQEYFIFLMYHDMFNYIK